MARGMQQIEFIGNLGRDPEHRVDAEMGAWCAFNVAVDDGYGTTWFSVTTKGPLADACAKYLAKGRQVFVSGVMKSDKETGGPRVYERRDGTAGATYEVMAFKVLFLGSGEAKEEGGDFLF